MQELAKSAHLDVAVEHLVALGTDKVLPGNGGRFAALTEVTVFRHEPSVPRPYSSGWLPAGRRLPL